MCEIHFLGLCDCDGINWSGDTCNSCSDKFYGPLCQPLMKVFTIAPSSGPDIGGNLVHVFGHNFPKNGKFRCRFVIISFVFFSA